jgi:hypothetical protein
MCARRSTTFNTPAHANLAEIVIVIKAINTVQAAQSHARWQLLKTADAASLQDYAARGQH